MPNDNDNNAEREINEPGESIQSHENTDSATENIQENAGGLNKEAGEKEEISRDWENEYDELYDKYIRLYSDFDNFRRRTTREKIDLIDHANTNLILDILPVIDDFDRAIQFMDTVEDVKSIKDGVILIYNKFQKILEEKGLKEIDTIGKEFDPDLHEAIAKIPAPRKKMKNHIVDQVLKGYYLKEKVIRHSKVVIGE